MRLILFLDKINNLLRQGLAPLVLQQVCRIDKRVDVVALQWLTSNDHRLFRPVRTFHAIASGRGDSWPPACRAGRRRKGLNGANLEWIACQQLTIWPPIVVNGNDDLTGLEVLSTNTNVHHGHIVTWTRPRR